MRTNSERIPTAVAGCVNKPIIAQEIELWIDAAEIGNALHRAVIGWACPADPPMSAMPCVAEPRWPGQLSHDEENGS
jgi:hypothetical protein